ncbi:hypothetical protein KC19_VG335400 [Ceratodon purpureus]|uniref:PWWP domain-containing protein n=1 Tax=Ceratodon purpureus TaxID=3225 RepID=A0A8T0HX54_CERPU|nr:hypothetical protein KC19_VG335400 [Ceratodon purpureus]
MAPSGVAQGRGRGSKRGVKSEKVKSPEIEATYDSDSYENHVIDLRGDEEHQSARPRESDVRSSDFEDRSFVKDEAQSQSESSFENGVEQEVDGSENDSGIVVTQSEELVGGAVSNGATATDPQISDVGEGVDGDTDEGTSMAVAETPPRFVHGQLVWAKFARFPWWPAEIINERAVKPGTGGSRRSNADVLVRFFGTYDYGWVDPKVGLSEFDVKLQERSKIKKKALQKGIEEALEFRKTGKLPDSFTVDVVIEQEEPKTPKESHSNGIQENGNGQQSTPEDEGTEQRRAARKRKPKVLYEEEERVQRKPERRLRRLRIMRQLGLAAPAGSPFILDIGMSV